MNPTKELETHVFHIGAGKSYQDFMELNRNRVISQEVTEDRVLVHCRPRIVDGNQIFVAGHFGRDD